MKVASGRNKGVTETVVIKDAVQIGSENPRVFRNAAVTFIFMQNREGLRTLRIHRFTNVYFITIESRRRYRLTEKSVMRHPSSHLSRELLCIHLSGEWQQAQPFCLAAMLHCESVDNRGAQHLHTSADTDDETVVRVLDDA